MNNVHMPKEDGSEGQRLQTVGATSASIKLGPRVGCTIGILDILAVVPVFIIKLLYPEQFYYLMASVFVVVGHNWPIYYRFRGGGGMSPTYQGFLRSGFHRHHRMCAGRDGLRLFHHSGYFDRVYIPDYRFFLLWMILFKGDWRYIVYAVVMNIVFTIALICGC